MEIIHLLILFIAGMAVAFINTISAAGSLVSLSAFMFCGLSSVQANATNRIAIVFHNLFAVKGFESKGIKGDNYKWWLAVASLPGSVLGAFWAINIPEHVFNTILLGVMVFFLFVTILNPLKGAGKGEERMETKHKIAGVIIYFFIGIYGGFIQAGSGLFLMSATLLLHRFNINKTNYYKAFVTLAYTLAAVAIFVWKGNINWFYGLVMSAGTALGGWLTSRWSVTVDERWLQRLMIVLILALTVYVWFFK